MLDNELHERLNDCDGYWQADLELLKYDSKYLTGLVSQDALDQLEIFGRTGSDGYYCVWKLPDARRPVIYFCDEGVDTCLVSRNFADFVILIAIGYYRFPCDPADPAEIDSNPEVHQGQVRFRAWVSELLQCEIPQTASSLAIHSSSEYPNIVEWFDKHWIRREQEDQVPIGWGLGIWLGKKTKSLLERFAKEKS